MNKLFSKIAALSVGLAMAVGVGVALGHQGVREVRADEGSVTINSASSNTDGVVTVTIDKATGSSAPITGDYGVRLYANNTVTITCDSNITALSIPWTKNSKKNFASVTADVGTYSHPSAAGTGTWSGSSKTVVLTVGSAGQIQFASVSYTIESSGTKYAVIDRIDNGSLDKNEVSEGATLIASIVPDGSYTFPESVTVLMAGSPASFTYENGVVTVPNVQGNVSIEGACVKVNQIQAIYSQSSGASVDVYGIYVGFLDGTGPVIMDGEYGVVVYNSSADVSGYTAGTTVLHVTGSVSIYKGLYEIGSATIEEATTVPEDKVPSTPVVYATKGGETADYASRLTTVTGTATVTSGSFDSAAGTADIKMNFTVGAQTVQVFYKKAAQTADSEAFAAMKAAVEGGSEITIKGFTGWYNGFQVQMNGYVPAAEGYTAEQFAQDLLNQTDAVCAGWKEGDNNHDALVAIWSNLAASDKYPSLPSDQKTILAEAERDEEGTVVEQAMARYDFLTGKYELSNFINGRTPIQSNYNFAPSFTNNNSYIIIIVISAVSVMSFGLALFLRKKRSK